jgi:hypothetical protein
MSDTVQPVTLQALLRDSGNMPITDGWLEVEADGLISGIYQNPKPLVTRRPRRFTPDSNGLISIEMINSEDSGVTYKFTLGYTTTTTSGTPPVMISTDIITDQFHAYLPRPVITTSGSVPVNLADLVPTGISLSSLDSSIARIAEQIVTDPLLRQRAVQPFRIMGVFSPSSSYYYGDIVTLATSPVQTWVCTARSIALPATTVTTVPGEWLRLL